MSQPASTNRNHHGPIRNRIGAAVVLCACAINDQTAFVLADDEAAPRTNHVRNSVDGEQPKPRPGESDETMRSVSFAVMILAVITISGLTMLFVVILWGHRLRRMVHSKPPKQTVVDNLWYLRSRNKIPEDAEPDTSAGDTEPT